jgi:hypothetical protein
VYYLSVGFLDTNSTSIITAFGWHIQHIFMVYSDYFVRIHSWLSHRLSQSINKSDKAPVIGFADKHTVEIGRYHRCKKM